MSENLIVGFCLDESGSMSACRDATISGFNEFLNDTKKQEGETRLTLCLFSSDRQGAEIIRIRNDATPIEQVEELSFENYRPEGNTPLLDAVGHVIHRIEEFKPPAGDSPADPWPVLIVIQTDGQENASREYNRNTIYKLVQEKEKQGWRFIYLGANMDEVTAGTTGQMMGVSVGSTMSYSYDSSTATIGSVSVAGSGLRTNSSTSSANLLAETRKEAEKREEEQKKK